MIKIYNILRYVIPRILRHVCNLHIKETEISQKRSKVSLWNINVFIACIWIPLGVTRFKKQSLIVICSFVDDCYVFKIYVAYCAILEFLS